MVKIYFLIIVPIKVYNQILCYHKHIPKTTYRALFNKIYNKINNNHNKFNQRPIIYFSEIKQRLLKQKENNKLNFNYP